MDMQEDTSIAKMSFLALISGGKDSIYTICKLIQEGHILKGLLYLSCETETIDSFMFQTVGKEIAVCYSTCLNVPIYVYKTKCKTINKDMEYNETKDDEVEDLFNGIKFALSQNKFDAVSSGAIASEYQKNRVENICKRLNLTSLAPLYKRNQKELLTEMIDYGIDARVVKVAGGDLGREAINQDLSYIKKFYDNCKYKDANYCGEGGEYETLVMDCKYFQSRIKIKDFVVLNHPEEVGKIESVFFMKITAVETCEKSSVEIY